jgi:hypothetical protein
MVGGRATYMTLSPIKTCFQTRIDRHSYLQNVPRKKWTSHTHHMWVWGHNLLKISSPRPLFYGTTQLSWCPSKQNPALHSKCKIAEDINREVCTTDYYKLRCKSQQLCTLPLCTYVVQQTPTNFTKQSTSCKLNSCSPSTEVPLHLRNVKVITVFTTDLQGTSYSARWEQSTLSIHD